MKIELTTQWYNKENTSIKPVVFELKNVQKVYIGMSYFIELILFVPSTDHTSYESC